MSYSTPAKRGGVETVSHTHFIFPVLKSTEILQCLDELGIDVCKAELTEPQRHREKIRKIFWQLLEHCTGITEEDIEKQCPSNLDRFVDPKESELHQNFTDVLFLVEVRKMMNACGVTDFSWKDLHVPTAKRLRCHLSATINMAKFREEQLKIYAELNEPRHQLLITLEELHAENAQLHEQLNMVMAESGKKMEEYDIASKECQELESNIARSNKLQASKREEATQLKKDMTRLKDELAAATWSLQETQDKEQRMKAQVVSSPGRRKQEVGKKRDAYEKEKAEANSLQQKISDRKTETSYMQKAVKDLEESISLQNNVLEEASTYTKAAERLESTEKEVNANEQKASELEDKTNEAKRGLMRLEDKLAHMNKQSKMKMDAVQDNIEIAKEQLLIVERDRREGLVRVEAGEAEVVNLKDQIQAQRKMIDKEIATMMGEYQALEQKFRIRANERLTLIDSAM